MRLCIAAYIRTHSENRKRLYSYAPQKVLQRLCVPVTNRSAVHQGAVCAVHISFVQIVGNLFRKPVMQKLFTVKFGHIGRYAAKQLLRRGIEFFLCVGGIRGAHIAVQLDRCYSVSENPKHASMLCVIPKMLGVISSVSIKHSLELRL